MAEIVSTDVAVSIPPAGRDLIPAGPKLMSLAEITFGDGALTYPTGGVPLPEIGQFGIKCELQRLFVQQPVANGFVYKYDAENHKIKIYTQGFTTGSTAPAVAENGALVEDSLGAEGTPRIPNTIADTVYDMGGMIEVPNGSALSEATLPVMVIGE